MMQSVDFVTMRESPPRCCTYTSRHGIESMAPPPGCALISITDPGSPPAKLLDGWAAVLRLEFRDVYTDAPGAFEPAHARAIRDFVLQHKKLLRFVVNCEAGLSRSAGVALALDTLGWTLSPRDRAFTASPRVVQMMADSIGVGIEIPKCVFSTIHKVYFA